MLSPNLGKKVSRSGAVNMASAKKLEYKRGSVIRKLDKGKASLFQAAETKRDALGASDAHMDAVDETYGGKRSEITLFLRQMGIHKDKGIYNLKKWRKGFVARQYIYDTIEFMISNAVDRGRLNEELRGLSRSGDTTVSDARRRVFGSLSSLSAGDTTVSDPHATLFPDPSYTTPIKPRQSLGWNVSAIQGNSASLGLGTGGAADAAIGTFDYPTPFFSAQKPPPTGGNVEPVEIIQGGGGQLPISVPSIISEVPNVLPVDYKIGYRVDAHEFTKKEFQFTMYRGLPSNVNVGKPIPAYNVTKALRNVGFMEEILRDTTPGGSAFHSIYELLVSAFDIVHALMGTTIIPHNLNENQLSIMSEFQMRDHTSVAGTGSFQDQTAWSTERAEAIAAQTALKSHNAIVDIAVCLSTNAELNTYKQAVASRLALDLASRPAVGYNKMVDVHDKLTSQVVGVLMVHNMGDLYKYRYTVDEERTPVEIVGDERWERVADFNCLSDVHGGNTNEGAGQVDTAPLTDVDWVVPIDPNAQSIALQPPPENADGTALHVTDNQQVAVDVEPPAPTIDDKSQPKVDNLYTSTYSGSGISEEESGGYREAKKNPPPNDPVITTGHTHRSDSHHQTPGISDLYKAMNERLQRMGMTAYVNADGTVRPPTPPDLSDVTNPSGLENEIAGDAILNEDEFLNEYFNQFPTVYPPGGGSGGTPTVAQPYLDPEINPPPPAVLPQPAQPGGPAGNAGGNIPVSSLNGLITPNVKGADFSGIPPQPVSIYNFGMNRLGNTAPQNMPLRGHRWRSDIWA